MQTTVYDNNTLKTLADIVYETSGIVFKDSNITVLSSRLSTKLKEKQISDIEYIELIKTDKNELMSFIDFVTTNFTSFFRQTRQFEILYEEILDELIEKNKAKKEIKIWSAGCSTGEEPYTIAMIVEEYFESKKIDIASWNVRIIGSDISLESLFTAKEGRFPDKSLQKVDENFKNKYFIPVENDFIIKDNIKRMITFDYHNLIYDNGIRDVDVSFCRNVLIYFDEDIQKKVMDNISISMNDDGYLFIGHSESLIGLYDGFKPINKNKGIVYVKSRKN